MTQRKDFKDEQTLKWLTRLRPGDQVGFSSNLHSRMYLTIVSVQLTIEIYFTGCLYDQHRTEWAFTLWVISWHLYFIHWVFRQIRNAGLQNKGRHYSSFPWTWSSKSVSDFVIHRRMEEGGLASLIPSPSPFARATHLKKDFIVWRKKKELNTGIMYSTTTGNWRSQQCRIKGKGWWAAIFK